MKKYFLLSILLLLISKIQAQQISLIEYFFDTDPGIGNGRTISLNVSALDSTLQFNTNDLAAGLHRVGFRLKNSNNTWGSTTWSSFNLFNGTASGTPQITEAEYFWNTDQGVRQNTMIALNAASVIDTTFSIPYPVAGNGTKWLGMRLFNQTGYAGNVAYDSVSACLLSSAKAGFYIVQSGNVFGCTDTSTSFTSNRNVKWYVNNFRITAADNSFVYNFDAANQPPGAVAIKQVAGEGCQLDSVTKFISVTGFNKISPSHADSTQNISIYISGGGFDSSNLIVEMVPVNDGNRPYLNGGQLVNGEPSIPAVFKKVYGNRSYIEAKFKVPAAQMPADNERKLYGIRIINAGVNLSPGTNSFNAYSPEAIFCIYGKKYWVDNSDRHYAYIENDITMRFVFPAYYHKWPDLPDQQQYVDKKNAVINRGQGSANAFSVDITGPSKVRLSETVIKTIEVTNNSNEIAYDVPVYVSMPYNNVRSDFMIKHYWEDPAICGTTSIDCEYPVSDDRDPATSADPGADETAYPDDDFPTPNDFINESDNTLRTHVRQNLKKYPATDRMPDGTLIMSDRFDVTGLVIPQILPGETRKIPVKIKPGPRKTGETSRRLPIQATVDEPLTLPDESMNTTSSSVFDCMNEFLQFRDNYDLTHPDYSAAWHNYQNQKRMYYDKSETLGQEIQSMQFLLKRALFPNSPLAIIYRKRLKEREAVLAMYKSRWEKQLQLKKQTLDALREKCKDNERFLPLIFQDNLDCGLPYDPNYITGNSQYDDNNKHWINNRGPQHYTIGFENLPVATANAQHVYIIDTLDKAKFGLETFALSGFMIGDTVYNVERFSKAAQKLVGIKGRNDMKVNFSAMLDTATGVLRFDFYSMTADGKKTIDRASLDGFLPPNNTDGVSGTGSVSFNIYSTFLGTDSVFSNKAHIYFDNNTPIVTNTWLNTVDTTAPTGSIVKALPLNDSTVGLVLQKSDKGSGYANAMLYGKKAGEANFYNMGNVWGDTLQVEGKSGETWQYYIVPVDHVGNTGNKSRLAEVTHTFGLSANTTLFIIYPVPAQQFFQIKTDKVIKEVQVYDVQGRLMKSYAVSPLNTYSTQGLANGVYVIKALTDSGDKLSRKMVVLN